MKEIGFKGGGSGVSTINNTAPDSNGNVNIQTLTEAEYTALNEAVETVEESAERLTDLEQKVGNLENCGLSVVDGELCCTYNV